MSLIAITVMPAAMPAIVRATETEHRERTVSAVATTQTSPAAIARAVRSLEPAVTEPGGHVRVGGGDQEPEGAGGEQPVTQGSHPMIGAGARSGDQQQPGDRQRRVEEHDVAPGPRSRRRVCRDQLKAERDQL